MNLIFKNKELNKDVMPQRDLGGVDLKISSLTVAFFRGVTHYLK